MEISENSDDRPYHCENLFGNLQSAQLCDDTDLLIAQMLVPKSRRE